MADQQLEEIQLGPRTPAQTGGAQAEVPPNGVVQAITEAQVLDSVLELSKERLLPWETCALPSRGLYYGWADGIVEVHAMGLAADKILATPRLAATGQSLDYLLTECVRLPDPAFDPVDLLAGDRTFLFFYLRGITHGNEYEFAVTCPNQACGKASTHLYDLNELAKTIKVADTTLGSEPFRVVLPHLSKVTGTDFWVGIRFARGRDTNNQMTARRAKKRFATAAIRAGKQAPQSRVDQPTIDDTINENLEMVIQTAMGVSDRAKIAALCTKLHSTDTAVIREWLRDHSPGIEDMISLDCPECGQEIMISLPITESFFRPTQRQRKP